MLKIVLDADGAIKLTRAGVLQKVVVFASCVMTEQVYAEIMRGKEKMYEDAFMIEGLVDARKLKVVKVAPAEVVGLGEGERSVLAFVEKAQIDAVISDDQRFLAVLERKEIPYIIPTDLVAVMAVRGHLTNEMAYEALDALRHFVSQTNYQSAKDFIGGG